MIDDFVHRFGQLDLGPTHPANPKDPARSLYDVSSLAVRYHLNGDAAIDAQTGEIAFRAARNGKIVLPDGSHMTAPKFMRREPRDAAKQLYGSRQRSAVRASASPMEISRLAAALYPAKARR
ncbi:MAG: hypothetical protein U1E37_02765 [Sphingomonadaceae bacterium]